LLRWIVRHDERRGYMPTIREMALAFKMKSHTGARYYLAMLDERGYIVRARGLARTLRVTEAGAKAARA
jgi:SOS-response transcriptional repressor LexA